ncbi:hypothetical protein DN752_21010 [Echinicola strongylocentroti]|uniref:Uncharacterized protein n=1 Tax=Echinicola strongylocentroti TaxID=1795355 RepID=A0A2Z4IQ54_9BACT|nr:hypothetical protein [Echinicola strongylocentroti]AWW32423.1 hypothetical protein DN752_21010 [Echinicola strongylocentroti]
MTSTQEEKAEIILNLINKRKTVPKGVIYHDYNDADGSIKMQELQFLISLLEERGLIILKGASRDPILTITEEGLNFPGFEKQREIDAIAERKKEEREKLEIKNLKGSVFQVKYWWVILLLNSIISFLIAYLTKS